MHIQWLGEGGIKITTKDEKDEKITLLIDPPSETSGLKVRGGIVGDIVAISSAAVQGDITVPDPRYLLEWPGEYEIKGIPLLGRKARDITLWRVTIEGVRVGHLGAFSGTLNEGERAFLANCDVLMVPIGGHGVLSSKEAAEVVRLLEPSIVIPLYFATDGLVTERDMIEKFLKELPCPQERCDKCSIRSNDIPSEGIKMYILEV